MAISQATGSPTGGTSTTAAPATPLTDSIDWGGAAVDTGEFNADGDMVVEYFFMPGTGFFQFLFPRLEWTEYEKEQVAAAFDTYEAIIDVEFVETDTKADADFKLNKINSLGLYLGVMNPPGEPGAGSAGFAGQGSATGWDPGDANGNPTSGGLEQGGFGFVTLIHEFGHGLGLAHPHDNGGGSSIMPGVDGDPQTDTGTFDLNQGIYTTMSYVDGWATNPDGALSPNTEVGYGYQGTPMALDIAVLQEKYGANNDYMTGDDVYLLPDANGPGTYYSSIWDAGGTDEIRYDGSRDVVIDLREATLQVEPGGGGWLSYAEGIYGGYTIANGVVIENATGGTGDDALVANAADNILTGGGGANTYIFTADGGGIDRLTDFDGDWDVVDVRDLGIADPRTVDTKQTGLGFAAMFDDQTLLFEGLTRADLSPDNFILT